MVASKPGTIVCRRGQWEGVRTILQFKHWTLDCGTHCLSKVHLHTPHEAKGESMTGKVAPGIPPEQQTPQFCRPLVVHDLSGILRGHARWPMERANRPRFHRPSLQLVVGMSSFAPLGNHLCRGRTLSRTRSSAKFVHGCSVASLPCDQIPQIRSQGVDTALLILVRCYIPRGYVAKYPPTRARKTRGYGVLVLLCRPGRGAGWSQRAGALGC